MHILHRCTILTIRHPQIKRGKKMDLASLTGYYLYFSLFVNLFRVTIYILKPEDVSSVKVTPEAWKNKWVQETMLAYSRVILLLMAFRSAICFWGLNLPDSLEKRQLCSILFLFDAYMTKQVFFPSKSKKDSIMVHQQDGLPPKIIQLSVFLFGTFLHYYWLF